MAALLSTSLMGPSAAVSIRPAPSLALGGSPRPSAIIPTRPRGLSSGLKSGVSRAVPAPLKASQQEYRDRDEEPSLGAVDIDAKGENESKRDERRMRASVGQDGPLQKDEPEEVVKYGEEGTPAWNPVQKIQDAVASVVASGDKPSDPTSQPAEVFKTGKLGSVDTDAKGDAEKARDDRRRRVREGEKVEVDTKVR